MTGVLEGRTVRALRVYERRLRWPVPRALAATLAGRRLQRIDRRGKYLLWRFEHGVLISHLGMTGSWRLYPYGAAPERGPHDHVDLDFDTALARLTDPRRFGALLWHRAADGDVERHPLLASLGVEPLDPGFDGARLYLATRGRSAAIKQVLLAGDAVVGVGNIYASESLFDAGIDPRVPARRLGPTRCARLAAAIRRCWPRPSRRADRRCAITHRPMARRGSMRCKHACTAAMARTARCAAVQFEGSYRVSAPHTGARFASGAEHCGRRPCRGVAVETLVRPRGLT